MKIYDRDFDHSYACGIFPSIMACDNIKENCIKLIYSSDAKGDGFDLLRQKCKDAGIRLELAPKLLSKISSKQNNHCAMMFKKALPKVKKDGLHLVLHNISDKGNLGSIVRSAVGFDVKNIVIIRPAVDLYEPSVVRSSMGAIFSLNFSEYNSFEDYYKDYPEKILVPFVLRANRILQDFDLEGLNTNNISLVFGNEGSGLPSYFEEMSLSTKIQHSNNIDSLNLSNAVSIALYHFSKNSFKE